MCCLNEHHCYGDYCCCCGHHHSHFNHPHQHCCYGYHYYNHQRDEDYCKCEEGDFEHHKEHHHHHYGQHFAPYYECCSQISKEKLLKAKKHLERIIKWIDQQLAEEEESGN